MIGYFGEVIIHHDSYLLIVFLFEIFCCYFDVYFCCLSLKGVFLRYQFGDFHYIWFLLFQLNRNYCTCSYGVYVLIYCCVGYGICIYELKIEYCSVVFLIINKNMLLPFTRYSFECYALLPLFISECELSECK